MKLFHSFLIIILLGVISSTSLRAQVGINILYPDTSAILHLESTDRGLLFPRMTTAQRDAIVQPKAGLMIYNHQDSLMQYFNGECWLNTFMQDCDDCYFEMTPSSIAGTIDRVIEDSISFTIDINQNNGNPQNIALTVVTPLPPGITYTINPNPQFSSGIVDVTFHATPFAPDGTFPIVIQIACGNQTTNFIYSLTLTPCYEVTLINSLDNYDLSDDLYATYPSLNSSIPVCVVSIINTGVTVSSTDTANPAYTTGNLHPNSILALVNNGNIIGKGGNGGIAYDPANGTTGEGFDGGDAVNLTVNTDVVNNFNIYGGGGGGNAMAFAITYTIPLPFPLPNITLGFMIGAGGGGAAGGGEGGNIPNVIGLTFYEDGFDGTAGQFGVAGEGGVLTAPIDFNAGVATITLTPSVTGGNGGEYGYPGTQGTFDVFISVTAVIAGFPVTIVNNIPLNIPVPPPAAGNSGFAIKRNGSNCNIPDNLYNTANLKGEVGN